MEQAAERRVPRRAAGEERGGKGGVGVRPLWTPRLCRVLSPSPPRRLAASGVQTPSVQPLTDWAVHRLPEDVNRGLWTEAKRKLSDCAV